MRLINIDNALLSMKLIKAELAASFCLEVLQRNSRKMLKSGCSKSELRCLENMAISFDEDYANIHIFLERR